MKRRIIIILIIVGILGGLTTGTWLYLRRNSGPKLLRRAKVAIQAEKFDKALGLAEKYITKYPTDWQGHYVKARAYIRLGQYDNARSALVKAGNLDPTEVSIPIRLAESYSLPAGNLLVGPRASRGPGVPGQAIKQFNQANEILLKVKTTDPKLAADVQRCLGVNYHRIGIACRMLGERRKREAGIADASRDAVLAAAKRKESEAAFDESDKAADKAIKALLHAVREGASNPFSTQVLVKLCIRRGDEESLNAARKAIKAMKRPPPIPVMMLALHDFNDEANTASGRKRLDKLCRVLDDLLKKHPDELEVKLARAKAALMLEDLETAERLCEEMLKGNRNQNQEALFIKAKVRMKKGDVTGAEIILYRLAAKHPNNWADVHFAYAEAAEKVGKKELAREALRKIVTKINPDYVLARRHLIASLAKDEFYKQALTEAQDYHRSHPKDPVALMLIVKTAKRIDPPDIELAKRAMEKAYTDNPSDPDMLLAIAEGYKLLADRAKAQQVLRKAAECKSDTAAGLFAIARAMLQVGRSSEAEKILLDELARDPEQSRVCFELGRFYLSAGRVMQAIKQFRAALRIDSGNTVYRMALARAMFGIGDLEQCMDVLEQADRSSTEASLLRLQVELLQGKSVSTERMLQEIHGVKRAGLPLAMIYFKSGRPKQCVGICLAEIKKTPDNYSLHFLLGQAYLVQGQRDKCLEQWSKVLKAAPKQLPVYLRIAGVLVGRLSPPEVEKALLVIPGARRDMVDLTMARLFAGRRDFNASAEACGRLIDRAGSSEFSRNRARLLRAKAMAAGGKLDQAVAELDKLSKNEAWHNSAMATKVHVLIKAGQIDKASNSLSELSNIAIKKKDPVALRQIALLYANLKKTEEALAVCDQLEILFPVDAWTYLMRARVLSMGGRSSEMFPLLEKAIKLQPGALKTYQILAMALDADQRPHQALEALKRMEKQGKSGSGAALFEQGHLFARWGLYAQSIECFQKLTAQGYTGIPKMQLVLGRAFAGLGQKDRAGDLLKNVSVYSPQYVPAQQLMVEIAETDKEKLELLDRLEKVKPGHIGVLMQKMRVLLKADKPEEAVKAFHSFVDRYAENRLIPAGTAYFAIRVMLAADDREAASKLVLRMVKDAPVPPWRQLAILLNMDDKIAAAKMLPSVEKANRYDAMLGLVLSVQKDDKVSIQNWAGQIDRINSRLAGMPKPRKIPLHFRLLVALAAGRISQAETELANYKSTNDVGRQAVTELVSLARRDAKTAAAEAANLLKASVAIDLGLAMVGKSLAIDMLKARPECQWAAALVIKSQPDPATLKVLLETIKPADCVLARTIRASLLMNEGEYEKAAEVYRKVAEVEKDNPHLVLAQAIATEKAGHLPEALSLYRKVWRVTQDPVAANNAAYLVSQLHPTDTARLTEALQWTEAAVKTFPRALSFRDTRGWIAFLLGKKEQARRDVRHAIKGLPNSPEVHYHLGVIEADAGNRNLSRWHLAASVSSAEAIKTGGGKLSVAEAKALKLAKAALTEGSPSEK